MRREALSLCHRRGPVKRLHVNRHVVAANRKSGRNDPALTVQTSAGSVRTRRVRILGRSELVQSERPLKCGARVWVETRAALRLEV